MKTPFPFSVAGPPCFTAAQRLLLAACLTIGLGDLFAAGPTLVSGNVSGTWSPANNPYVVVDHCTVPDDKTLTIQPGTEVIIGQGLNLTVNGNILARGTPAQRIIFRAPNTNTYWGSINIFWNQRASEFNYCDFVRGTEAIVLDVGGALSREQTLQLSSIGCLFESCARMAIRGRSAGGMDPFWRSVFDTQLRVTMRACAIRTTPTGLFIRAEGTREDERRPIGYGSAMISISSSVFDSVAMVLATMEGDYPGNSSGQLHNNVFANCQTALDLKATFDCSVRNNIFANCKVGVKRTGTTSGQVGFNCFHNTPTKFVGYPSAFGTVAMNNANGTPCDVAFNIFENPKFAETLSFLLAPDSPCVDAGDPAAAFNDVQFPPSRGKAVNDIGAYGGPNVLADDADMDGLLDAWEIQYFGNLETTDGASDPDDDGLINTKEALYGTNPAKADTDGDGFNDLAEVLAGTSPTDPNSLPNFALAIKVAAYDLELNTAAGRRYQLQASEGLGLWDNLFDPIAGDGNVIRRRVEVGEIPYRFFKVKDVTNP